MDKHNYARWLTVHVFDLITMHVKYLEVYKNLKKGFFLFKSQIKNLGE